MRSSPTEGDSRTISSYGALVGPSVPMSLDRDYPMSRTQVRVLVAGLVAMAITGGLLFGGAIPGLKPNYAEPTTITVDGEAYHYTTVELQPPNLFTNSTPPQLFQFQNVSFYLWVTNWGSLTGGLVRGNGTEPNGTCSNFVLGQSTDPPVNSNLYISRIACSPSTGPEDFSPVRGCDSWSAFSRFSARATGSRRTGETSNPDSG